MTTKRAYKLLYTEEFVAHSSTVNCLKIGRKSPRVLVTGGEDHKVNLWAIGKPNSILSLSGHTSGIDSVSFDSLEVLVAAGAASGTIKLWDLEEAKIVRTFTGHRSNCTSLDFHPFGEFFASGSLDTNLKIWDIRKKGCIHTYKGHSRGVNSIRFTPDGRWVVSGGEDNTVKLWDLTAGKLLHDFKNHEGQIQCIDFHPHEFLLATGSADKTVKLWDLETLELIGSSGPEATGVRCLTFNPDGRTLLCGLHESLKVLSWEPIRCHDGVDVGWSRLSDLNVHEGKLLACSHNQNCVGVWVVDTSHLEPYSITNTKEENGHSKMKNSSGNLLLMNESKGKASSGRISTTQNSDTLSRETTAFGRLSVSQNSDSVKDPKILPLAGSSPGTPQSISFNIDLETLSASSVASAVTPKKNSTKALSTFSASTFNKSDVTPVVVPKTSSRSEPAGSRKELRVTEKIMSLPLQPKIVDCRRFPTSREEVEKPTISYLPEPKWCNDSELKIIKDSTIKHKTISSSHDISTEAVELKNAKENRYIGPGENETDPRAENISVYHESYETWRHKMRRDRCSKEERIRPLPVNWEKRGRSNYEQPASNVSPGSASSATDISFRMFQKSGYHPSAEKETTSSSDEDIIARVLDQHDQFISSMQSRSTRLQVIFRFWERNDIKGVVSAMEKMADDAVVADVVSVITEKTDTITLDMCTCLLPRITGLLESDMDRFLVISLEMLLKLVRVFGSVIYSCLSSSSVGVDIEAEQRLERCKLCFAELEKVKSRLPSLTRRGGLMAKLAHELHLALREVSLH